MPRLVVESLGNLVRCSKNIRSINLENTGLNAYVLCHLVPYVRHAKSLLCLHLAQNPGVSDTVKQFYQDRLSIAPKENSVAIDVKRDRDDLSCPLTPAELQKLSQA